ncbi:unnamed protein product [Adineta steineri]|uniref:T-cell immunomodulatory protein TIP C2 domain-containing protein n=1 Tax=Adineta steineri TaxID=433720 RepID=A0A815N7D9_9BILA|nr:unnamed protein product [Adineta steineri]
MNYAKNFRSLPWSIFFRNYLIIIFVFQSFVNGKNDQTKKSNNNGDEKRVFDVNFGTNKNYAIDDCIPLAFGDFNADKIIDIFCRNTKGDTIRVMVNDDRSPTSKEICKVNITGVVYDALAADFDADSKLDLFVLYKLKPDQIGYNGGILWGNRVKLNDLQPIDYLFENIPTTLDANGDSYVELLGMISIDKTTFKPACLYLKNRAVTSIEYLPDDIHLRTGTTQATVDLNNDLVADLFLTITVNNAPKFRLYELPITKLTLIKEYDPPPGIAIYHLSTFADIDADGELEHILPVCMKADCSDSRIYVRDDDEWHQLPIKFGDGVRFPLKNELPSPLDQIPLSIKISDYNLDGYPDIVTVMKQRICFLLAVQMSQSGQLTLELPYVIIGLGSTPNFVEKITVGVPPNIESNKLFRTYTQMIPNSQVVVVPSPLMNPEKWHSKLFITPSRMILHTGIALGVTLIVLAGALAILQYREKLEDDRERKVQAQAFHYDAL